MTMDQSVFLRHLSGVPVPHQLRKQHDEFIAALAEQEFPIKEIAAI
jgi:hypothetical protein